MPATRSKKQAQPVPKPARKKSQKSKKSKTEEAGVFEAEVSEAEELQQVQKENMQQFEALQHALELEERLKVKKPKLPVIVEKPKLPVINLVLDSGSVFHQWEDAIGRYNALVQPHLAQRRFQDNCKAAGRKVPAVPAFTTFSVMTSTKVLPLKCFRMGITILNKSGADQYSEITQLAEFYSAIHNWRLVHSIAFPDLVTYWEKYEDWMISFVGTHHQVSVAKLLQIDWCIRNNHVDMQLPFEEMLAGEFMAQQLAILLSTSPAGQENTQKQKGNRKMFNGKELCSNFYNGMQCISDPCTRVHMCLRCKLAHTRAECPKQAKN
jgi:hypothetical protein